MPISNSATNLSKAIRRTLSLSVFEGSLTQAFLNWTTGSVLIGYMLHFGATPTHLGLVASVPLLAQISSPFAAWLASYAARLKAVTIVLALVGRGLWILAALLPQFVSGHLLISLLIVLVAISSFFQASVGTLWASWMGDVIPQKRRGRYFGFRTGVVGLVGMLTNLAAGWFLDIVAAPINFQVVLSVGVLSAVIGIALLPFHHEPPRKKHPHPLKETLQIPWRDLNFRKFLMFGIYWNASVMIAAPFVMPYFLDQLQMSFTQVAIWSAIAAVTALGSTVVWGRVADEYGNKAVLQIGTFLVGLLLPLTWILATPGNLWPIWISAAFDAIAWGAVGPAIFNLALVSAPKEDRLPYIAMFSLVTGIAGFLGGVLSGPLFTLFQVTSFSIRGYDWTAYHTLFALSGLLRMQAWRFVRPLQETHSWRARDVLKQVRFGWRGLGFPWRNG